MSLLSRARVTAQIEHRETDRVPYTIRFEGEVEARLDTYYGSSAWRSCVRNDIERISVAASLQMLDRAADKVYSDPYGSVWRTDLRPYHLTEPALRAPSLAGYVFPSPDAVMGPNWEEGVRSALAQAPGTFNVAVFGAGVWERAWALRGFENLLMDVAGEPAFAAALIERVADHQLMLVERILTLPFDGILFMDDWGYQRGVLLGAPRWRRLLKPHLARTYARVHQMGKYVLHHCCGSIVEILPDLIAIGIDVLESVQPEAEGMHPYALKRAFGERITFWGGLGSQSIIPFGSPAQIRAEISRLACEMSRGGGYILSPSKPLQPETPAENAAAVVEGCLEQAGIRLP